MRRLTMLACSVLVGLAAIAASSQSRSPSNPVLYEGGRLIIGDGTAPLEAGAFLVQNGRISALGRKGMVPAPAGATRVDLTGKTVMPAWINVHVHIGYEGYTSWGAENYTPRNVLDHLEREAFYGIGATVAVGSSPTAQAIQFQQDQQAGKFPPASRFFFMPGMAPPNGGPDAILIKATTALHAVYEVSTGPEARAAIREMSCGPATANAATREEMLANNFPKMVAAGARLVLGTDAGIVPRHSFGWADHHEVARYVQLGLDASQAIVAATQRPAELLGIKDMGTLAVGKSADFVVLNANPLESIRNTRQITNVSLRGAMLNRDVWLAEWKKAN